GGEGAEATVEKKISDLKENLEEKLSKTAQLSRLAQQVRVMRAPEGVRIDLVDDADFSMFALGTTILTHEARLLLEVLGQTLAEYQTPLIVRGHTDSLPWRDGRRTNNWSLSTGRAEATRQSLILNGMTAERFARIEGVADREPLIADNPKDPRNRRISLLMLENTGSGAGRGRRRPSRSVLTEEEIASAAEVSSGPDVVTNSEGTTGEP
ncbi:MAG: OmpA family protein, partial [Pseudomonadota bacterium]